MKHDSNQTSFLSLQESDQQSLLNDEQTSAENSNQPLAAKMRPKSLADYLGQEHILGLDAPLRLAIEQGQCHSVIFWGPPGTGKTTLAEIIARYVNAKVIRLSAVTSGIKDIRLAIEQAKIRISNEGSDCRTVFNHWHDHILLAVALRIGDKER